MSDLRIMVAGMEIGEAVEWAVKRAEEQRFIDLLKKHGGALLQAPSQENSLRS